MVLPTTNHVALAAWLERDHGVRTSELAGLLVTSDLDGLLDAAGSARRLDDGERVLLAAAGQEAERRRLSQSPGGDTVALAVRVRDLLGDLCDALAGVDVVARPYQGLGRVHGWEILLGRVQVSGTEGLYDRLRATGPGAD